MTDDGLRAAVQLRVVPGFDADGRTLPAEMLPPPIIHA